MTSLLTWRVLCRSAFVCMLGGFVCVCMCCKNFAFAQPLKHTGKLRAHCVLPTSHEGFYPNAYMHVNWWLFLAQPWQNCCYSGEFIFRVMSKTTPNLWQKGRGHKISRHWGTEHLLRSLVQHWAPNYVFNIVKGSPARSNTRSCSIYNIQYIHNITTAMRNCNTHLYADDTVLYCTARTARSAVQTLTQAFDQSQHALFNYSTQLLN